jgi:hypothetical protein
MIPVFERAKTVHALDRVATVIGSEATSGLKILTYVISIINCVDTSFIISALRHILRSQLYQGGRGERGAYSAERIDERSAGFWLEYLKEGSSGNTVGIVTGCVLDGRGSISGRGKKCISFPQCPDRL